MKKMKLKIKSLLHCFTFSFLAFNAVLVTLPVAQSSAAGQSQKPIVSDIQPTNDEYLVGPGDSLEILVWKEPDLSRSYAVRIDGRISVPLLGDIKVSGKTIAELIKILEVRFAEVVTEPNVSVILNESKSWRYYVIGQVIQSGEFNMDYPISALQAIAKCGGFSEWAKKDRIKIIRSGKEGKKILTFNFEALAEKNDLNQDILLGPGDTILVP